MKNRNVAFSAPTNVRKKSSNNNEKYELKKITEIEMGEGGNTIKRKIKFFF